MSSGALLLLAVAAVVAFVVYAILNDDSSLPPGSGSGVRGPFDNSGPVVGV